MVPWSRGLGRLLQDGPYESTEFPGDCSDGDMAVLARAEPAKRSSQSALRFHGDSDDGRWLSLASALQGQRGRRAMAIVPGGLGQQAACVGIVSVGDGAPPQGEFESDQTAGRDEWVELDQTAGLADEV